MPIPNQPAPSPKIFAYERTTQSIILDGVTANAAQVGNAAPVAANVYGMVGVVSRGQLPYNLVLQVDVASGVLASSPTVTLLGSLDNVNFYSLGSVVVPVGGGIFPFSGILARYITASLSGYAVTSGTPAITVTLAA